MQQLSADESTVDPPNTAALGTGKKQRYWKTTVKEVIYLTKKKILGT